MLVQLLVLSFVKAQGAPCSAISVVQHQRRGWREWVSFPPKVLVPRFTILSYVKVKPLNKVADIVAITTFPERAKAVSCVEPALHVVVCTVPVKPLMER